MAIVPIDDNDIAAARALRVAFGHFWSTTKGEPRDVYDSFIAQTPLAQDVATRAVKDRPGPGWWCEAADGAASRAILFLHGGGYGLGHTGPYVGLASQLATRTRVPVFLLEYPLAPEARLPVARDLAVQTLASMASSFDAVAVVGDSAGGGLSFATVLEARRQGIPVSSVVAFSPWTDLGLGAASVREFAIGDPLLDPGYLRACASAYLGELPATDPRGSPLRDPDLGLLPPTLIQVGSDEVLRDDSRRMAEAVAQAGAKVVFEEWQGMHHVFQLNVRELASARRALDGAAAFIEAHWAR